MSIPVNSPKQVACHLDMINLSMSQGDYRSLKKYFTATGLYKAQRERVRAWDNDTCTCKWYWQASSQQKQTMLEFLLDLDKSHRVDPEAPRTRKVSGGITRIMEDLSEKLQELEPRFKGRIVPMGSSQNGTKIGEPDEFDFVYEMDLRTLLSGRATFKVLKTAYGQRSLLLNVTESTDDLCFFSVPQDGINMENMLYTSEDFVGATKFEGKDCALNTLHISAAIYLYIDKALSQIQLPDGWSHGGFNRPKCSGSRLKLPSFMLQFEYLGDDGDSTILIKVDFVPVVQIPIQYTYQDDILHDFLMAYSTFCWLRIPFGHSQAAFYSLGEEKFFAEYLCDSIPKTLLRICKALLKVANLTKSRFITRQLHEELERFYKENTGDTVGRHESIHWRILQMLHTTKPVLDEPPDTDRATFNDIGESVGEFEYVPTYLLKRIIMTLMAVDKNRGHSWTREDLPDLVMSVLMVIFPDQSHVKVVVGGGSCLTLSDSHVQKDRSGLTTRQSSEAEEQTFRGFRIEEDYEEEGIIYRRVTICETWPGNTPRFYFTIKCPEREQHLDRLFELTGSRRVQLFRYMDSVTGIARLFKILQAVSEKKKVSSVEFDSFSPIEYVNEEFITKEQLKTIFPNQPSGGV